MERPLAVWVRDVEKTFRIPRRQMHTLKETSSSARRTSCSVRRNGCSARSLSVWTRSWGGTKALQTPSTSTAFMAVQG